MSSDNGANNQAKAAPGLKKKVLKRLFISLCIIAAAAVVYFVSVGIYKAGLEKKYPGSVVNYSGNTVCGRFYVPEGFVRDTYSEGSFQYEIQHLELKKFGLGAYGSDGKRLFSAPLWGVLLYSEETSSKLDKFGLGPSCGGTDASKTGAETGPDGIHAGCLCGYIDETTGEKIITGILLDVCRDEGGNVLAVAGVVSGHSDVYAAGAGGDKKTVWLDVKNDDFSFGSCPGAAPVFFEYDPY